MDDLTNVFNNSLHRLSNENMVRISGSKILTVVAVAMTMVGGGDGGCDGGGDGDGCIDYGGISGGDGGNLVAVAVVAMLAALVMVVVVVLFVVVVAAAVLVGDGIGSGGGSGYGGGGGNGGNNDDVTSPKSRPEKTDFSFMLLKYFQNLKDLHKIRTSRGQSFGSGTALLGIFGISGLASGLENNTGASGYFWHAKRCKTGERREEIGNWVGCPRILFIGGWSLGVRGAYCSTRRVLLPKSSLHASSEPLAASVDTFGVRGEYLGSDQNSYLLHTNSVFDVLYIHAKVNLDYYIAKNGKPGNTGVTDDSSGGGVAGSDGGRKRRQWWWVVVMAVVVVVGGSGGDGGGDGGGGGRWGGNDGGGGGQ
uniref:Uncharacterized protein n=1 Tax=Lactuca sativa TaxID=4236 RepID=A0A9R1UYB8_LACSA|nr:hypothetical protein LSAT_V11C700343920 [Lactuca sativa]